MVRTQSNLHQILDGQDVTDIYKNVHAFDAREACTRADVLRVSMDAFVWIAWQSIRISEPMVMAIDFNQFGDVSLFGLQVIREPLFPAMAYRIEGGCRHSGHLSLIRL